MPKIIIVKFPKKNIDYRWRLYNMKKQQLLNLKDVSEILCIKLKTLYQWKWMKKNLTFVKVGKSLRVDQKDLHDFIESQKRKPSEYGKE
jgi:predicted DNA-binding transcriptional regulator AlpA